MRHGFRLSLIMALGLSASGVDAAGIKEAVTAATITNTSGNCLAQLNERVSLTLDATGASANVGYCRGAGCTAAIGTTGTTTLASGSLHYWPADSAPIGAFCFISASGSQPVTIVEGRK